VVIFRSATLLRAWQGEAQFDASIVVLVLGVLLGISDRCLRFVVLSMEAVTMPLEANRRAACRHTVELGIPGAGVALTLVVGSNRCVHFTPVQAGASGSLASSALGGGGFRVLWVKGPGSPRR